MLGKKMHIFFYFKEAEQRLVPGEVCASYFPPCFPYHQAGMVTQFYQVLSSRVVLYPSIIFLCVVKC